jgi:hypothetical protein
MISDEPVNLSAVALEDMQVCFIPKSEVMGYFDKTISFRWMWWKVFVEI